MKDGGGKVGHTKKPRGSRAPDAAASIKKGDYVVALARGIDVLRLLSEDRPELSTSDVAELIGISRAAARRFLLTLTELGYLQNRGEFFRPRPQLLELGYTYLSTWRFPQFVTPYLEDVVTALKENSSFAVLDGTDVVYLARAETRRIVQSINVSIGTRIPATLSSLGRVLLAFERPDLVDDLLKLQPLRSVTAHTVVDPGLFRERLETIRRQGWAIINGEFEEDLISIAVPVLARDGVPFGAINVGAPRARADAAQMERDYLPVLMKAAERISSALNAAGIRPAHVSPQRQFGIAR